MADANAIAELRRLINEPVNAEPWTDEALSQRIDALDPGSSLRTLASSIWTEKAASYASLVDVKEGNSDRKMSQLYKQALEMAGSLGTGEDGQPISTRKPSRTRAIERM